MRTRNEAIEVDGIGVRLRWARPPGSTNDHVVVLVHGIGMSHRSFRSLQRVLATRHVTVAVDLPGFGGVPSPGRPLGFDTLARTVVEAVRLRHAVRSLTVVGQSMGTQVAVEAALRYPDLVTSVALIGPVVDDRRDTALQQAADLLLDTTIERPGMNAIVATDSLRSLRQYRLELPVMLRYPMLVRVAMLDVPVAVIRGTEDRIAGAGWARRIVRTAPNAALVELAGPHHVQERDPLVVARVIDALIAGRMPSAASGRSREPEEHRGRPRRVQIARWWVLDWLAATVGQVRALGPASPEDYRSGNAQPVIVLPGIYETWHFLEPLMAALHDAGHPISVVTALRHNILTLPASAEIVRQVIEREHLDRVLILAHSKGGLIGKYAMTLADPDGRIDRMIAIGTPFAGSSWARAAPVSHLRSLYGQDPVIAAMRLDRAVNARITSIYGVFDSLVPSGSCLDGATNVQLPVGGHFRILRDPRTVSAVLDASRSSTDGQPRASGHSPA